MELTQAVTTPIDGHNDAQLDRAPSRRSPVRARRDSHGASAYQPWEALDPVCGLVDQAQGTNLRVGVSLADYLIGLGFFLGTWGSVLAASLILVKRQLDHLAGATRVTAVGIVFSAALIGVHILPGALTLLDRETVLAFALVTLVGAWRLIPDARSRLPSPPRGTVARGAAITCVLAGVALGAFLLNGLYLVRVDGGTAVLHIDTLAFHLPGVARWIQTGSIWQNSEFLPRFPTGAYPNNGDIVFLSAVLPWRNDAFVRLVNIPWLALTGLAMYALALELRASRAAAVLLATTVLSVRAIASFGLVQLVPDVFLLATCGGCALFLVRHLHEPRRANLALAGVALGLAFGTKWYGLSSAIALLAAWVLAGRLARRRILAIVRQEVVLIGLIALFGGVWLIRNWILLGDPLYPAKISALGATAFNAPADLYLKLYGYSLFDRLGQSGVWAHRILPDLRQAIGGPGILIAVGVLVSVGILWRRRRELRVAPNPAVLLLLVSAILIAVAYVLTPATAQGPKSGPVPGLVGGNSRYAMPALVLAAPVIAWLATQLGRWGRLVELMAAVAAIDGLAQTFDFPVSVLVKFAAETTLAAVVVLLAVAWWRSRRWAGRRRLAGVMLAGAFGLVAAGEHLQSHFNHYRYRNMEATIDWVINHAARGHSIGIAGDWANPGQLESPILPLFGPRFRNDVSYVGYLNVGTLIEYGHEASFTAALKRGGYQLLLVGRGVRMPPPADVPDQVWARMAGFRLVAESRYFALLAAPTAPITAQP